MCNLSSMITAGRERPISRSRAKVGYRWCKIHSGGLRPVAYGGRMWNKSVARADHSPTICNSAGLHIYKNKTTALRDSPDGRCGDSGGFVLMRVRYWGEHVKHRRGVRAQFAEIIAIRYHPSKQPLIKTIKTKIQNKAIKWRCGIRRSITPPKARPKK